MERAIVSTSIGHEGLDVIDRQHLLTADTPRDFAAACITLLQQPDFRGALGQAGRQLVRSRYDWSTIRKTFALQLHAAMAAPR